MKFKSVFLAFFTGLFLFSCSKNDDESSTYSPNFIYVSDNIDCHMQDQACRRIYFVSKQEGNRIFELQEKSSNTDIYISGIGRFSQDGECLDYVGNEKEPFEGYLIGYSLKDCDFDFFGNY